MKISWQDKYVVVFLGKSGRYMKPDSIQLWIPYFLQMSSLISKSRCQKVNRNTSERSSSWTEKFHMSWSLFAYFIRKIFSLGLANSKEFISKFPGIFFFFTTNLSENANFATLKNQKHKNLTYSLLCSLFCTEATLQPNCYSIAISMATAQMNVTFYSSSSIDIYS